MDLAQFDQYVLVPALKKIGLYSPSAHVLMLGTGVIETNYQYLKQLGSGPALGVFEVEPDTYNDIYRFINKYENRKLKERCLAACIYDLWPDSEDLIYNLRWACIIARLKYFMVSVALPSSFDAVGMANYYKKYYNTYIGKSDIDEDVKVFQEIIKTRDKS